jgi:hypothetical protein
VISINCFWKSLFVSDYLFYPNKSLWNLKLNRKPSNQFYSSALTLLKLFFGVANNLFPKNWKILPKSFSPNNGDF